MKFIIDEYIFIICKHVEKGMWLYNEDFQMQY